MTGTVKNKRKDNVVYRILQGRWFSTSFFLKNAIIIISALIFLMIYISNKYQVQTKIETIHKLQQELERVKTESVRERSEYMSRTRESSMQQMIDTLHLGLEVREHPPFIINYSNRH